ncbi:MAG: hypothetical protein V7754_21335 [Halioglobus sp.]
MKTFYTPQREKGAITIFIAMVMLIMITGLIMTEFSMSVSNLRAVGNVQSRGEAISAARVEIEKVIGSPFTADPAGVVNNALGVDINNDSIDDYVVSIEEPICERALQANLTSISSVQLPGFSPGSAYNTIWRIRGTATDSISGASVTVVQRVRVLLTQVQKNAVCA